MPFAIGQTVAKGCWVIRFIHSAESGAGLIWTEARYGGEFQRSRTDGKRNDAERAACIVAFSIEMNLEGKRTIA